MKQSRAKYLFMGISLVVLVGTLAALAFYEQWLPFITIALLAILSFVLLSDVLGRRESSV